ncbi:MAG: HAMP domain-containing sensor histidine kinase [Deinococcota bacterium]
MLGDSTRSTAQASRQLPTHLSETTSLDAQTEASSARWYVFGSVRQGVSLRWRVALLCGLTIALLGVASSSLVYWFVRSRIISNIENSIILDARRVARVYEGGFGVAPIVSGPMGGLFVQIYSPQGLLLATSSMSPLRQRFADSSIELDYVLKARYQGDLWRGELGGEQVIAALEPVSFGVVAVISPTSFLSLLLRNLAQTLAITAVILSAVGAVAGYFVAQWSMRPVSRLAALTESFNLEKLRVIPYRGPDDEVGRLTRAYNALIEQLQDALAAQRVFLAETSHELRTPLTSMRGFLDRALRRANPEAKQDLQDARRIADTLSRLVADILQLSRGEIIRELVPHLLDPVDDVLKPISEEFRGTLLEGSSGSLLVGDPEQLQQLLRNLTANAVRACGDDPSRVTLRCKQLSSAELLTLTQHVSPTDVPSTDLNATEWIVFEVSDTGPGIDPQLLSDIFKKFYKGAGGGAGLGLAIARQIARAHEGDIEVASKPGVGTTFYVRLPSFADDGGDDGDIT